MLGYLPSLLPRASSPHYSASLCSTTFVREGLRSMTQRWMAGSVSVKPSAAFPCRSQMRTLQQRAATQCRLLASLRACCAAETTGWTWASAPGPHTQPRSPPVWTPPRGSLSAAQLEAIRAEDEAAPPFKPRRHRPPLSLAHREKIRAAKAGIAVNGPVLSAEHRAAISRSVRWSYANTEHANNIVAAMPAKRRCGRCGKAGHYATTCTTPECEIRAPDDGS